MEVCLVIGEFGADENVSSSAIFICWTDAKRSVTVNGARDGSNVYVVTEM